MTNTFRGPLPTAWVAVLFSVVLYGGFALPITVQAQSSDSLFAQARTAAFEEEDYGRARALAYRALEKSPNYHGIRVFVARTLAWEGRRDSARAELEYVLDAAPSHYEGLKAMIDVESWSGRYQSALQYADRGHEQHPDDSYFLEKRAELLRTLNRPKEARAQLNAILSADPSNASAKAELRRLKKEERHYTASLSYRRDVFRGGRLPWQFGTATLSRATPLGSIIGRVQFARRFASNGVKVGLDAYPSLPWGTYAYLNAGVSQSSIFPRYRLGASLYKSLPWSTTAELGFRYLNFGGGGTTIYTASLTKYRGSYMYKVGTYVTPSGGKTSVSVNGQVRRYFGNAQMYLGLSGSIGSSPAGQEAFEEDFQRTRSWGVSLQGQYPLNDRTRIGGSLGYDFEEFTRRTQRRVSATVSASYDF